MADTELEEFLSASELCDSNHQMVKKAGKKISETSGTMKKSAVDIFYFVRDEIPLAFVHPWTSASETIKMRRGSCLTKATLQVALLRSVGIPARFRIFEFRGDDPKEWEGILPSFAISRMPERWVHYLAEVYVEDRWLMADATFDRALIPDIDDWDGEKDVCSIEENAILSDLGEVASIEDEARKLDEKYKDPVFWRVDGYKFFWILNLYQRMQRLRNKVSRKY
jgi:hypothetical protein